MLKGEAPSEEIEQEWQRMLDAEFRLKEKLIRHLVCELILILKAREHFLNIFFAKPDDKTVFTLPDGYVTTAEPRPNAYIPESMNELPLPKPYGRLAPYKPQEPGSSMRHIKKPNPKPIEI